MQEKKTEAQLNELSKWAAAARGAAREMLLASTEQQQQLQSTQQQQQQHRLDGLIDCLKQLADIVWPGLIAIYDLDLWIEGKSTCGEVVVVAVIVAVVDVVVVGQPVHMLIISTKSMPMPMPMPIVSVIVIVIAIAIAVLFNYNYLFNHNFVRVSTIINHQMQCRQRPAKFCDWANCQADRLAAFSESRKPEKEKLQLQLELELGQAKWNALHASAMWQLFSNSNSNSKSHSSSSSVSFSCLAQKKKSSVSGSRTPQLSSQQSVSQSAR